MNLLDVAILALAATAIFGGWRIGFLARATSWAGLAAGLVVATLLLTPVLERLRGADETQLLLVTMGMLAGGAMMGQAVGLMVGNRLHLGLPEGNWRNVDRSFGGFAGLIGVAVSVWLLLPAMADVPGWPASQARNSSVGRFVLSVFPDPPDTLEAVRRLLNPDRFPQVFSALQPTPNVGPPPADLALDPAVYDRVVLSVARIEGVACGRLQEGSGFVAGPELVVTNAHVVAGEESTEVHLHDGTVVDATVVYFDPATDLAVLRAPGVGGRPALPIGDADVGDVGVVFGFPGGGSLDPSPFSVARRVDAVGKDLYDEAETRREVFFLASDLAPGDSGAALVDRAGNVVGVAFAVAPDRSSVAYALTVVELQEALGADLSAAADTGRCLR